MDLNTPSNTYPGYAGGYTCSICKCWVPWNVTHACISAHPQPYTPPATITITPITEERIREIIREEIKRASEDA